MWKYETVKRNEKENNVIYKPSSRPEGPAGGDTIGVNRVEASGSTRWGVRRGEKNPERRNEQ